LKENSEKDRSLNFHKRKFRKSKDINNNKGDNNRKNIFTIDKEEYLVEEIVNKKKENGKVF
jgi:hypothetical protein